MSDDIGAYALDYRWARRSFDRAAKSYDDAAVLHVEVRENLLERLALTTLRPRIVLDAGAGTGHGSRALKRRYPQSLVVAMDFSSQMLDASAKQRSWLRPFERLQADAGLLPFKDGSIDLIVSNLMLQWCDPDAVFTEFRRALAPEGLLTFSTFGPDTLRELRSAWAEADPHTHVHQFIDMHDLGDALVRAGFSAPVLDVERFTLRYLDVRKVAADLKATGAHNATAGRMRGLTGRRRFAAMQAAYERAREDGRLPATYEVVFAHAWVPAQSARLPTEPASVSLEELKRELRSRRLK
ncbi:MAG TPA: malonyl-ACP O-methyltransferase BioC [Steroidobacteraceae bacterium]|jgi:malonyl-CoA O-methyltransferase|nr:malonyl-ACP O-methyltransferase BioC [Steroidobacteraceae bacterium]